MNRAKFKNLSTMVTVAAILSACTSSGGFQDLKHKIWGGKPKETDAPELHTGEQEPRHNLGNITVAEAAKVTDAELEKAVAKPVAGTGQSLGTTIASLGLLDKTGFWLKTPLIESEMEGRVVYLKNGTSINLRLIPNGGDKGSSSQISVAAMQALGIPIVELAELQVFTR